MNPLEENLHNPCTPPMPSDSSSVIAPTLVEASSRPAVPNARRTLLCEQPLLVGASWARAWCDSMRTEGRGVHGGWPGTLPEARVRILQHLDVDLARRGMPLLSPEELAAATTAVYARAKRDWLQEARGMQVSAPKPSSRRSKS